MNIESLGPVVLIIVTILGLIYSVMVFLVPIFIYYLLVNTKKLIDEQRRANHMFEACLKRILEESIIQNRNLTTLINGLTRT